MNLASTRSFESDAADSQAFEAAFEAEQRRLFSIAFSILRDPTDAQDAVQETGLLGWRRRRLLRRILIDDAAHELRETADEHLTDAGRYIDIDRAYTKLSVRQRAVITLHYQHGYTLAECAELMGCSPGSVSQHLARGLKRLRRELVDE